MLAHQSLAWPAVMRPSRLKQECVIAVRFTFNGCIRRRTAYDNTFRRSGGVVIATTASDGGIMCSLRVRTRHGQRLSDVDTIVLMMTALSSGQSTGSGVLRHFLAVRQSSEWRKPLRNLLIVRGAKPVPWKSLLLQFFSALFLSQIPL